MSAARRAGLDLSEAAPHDLQATGSLPPLVVTVCDRAHEELDAPEAWLHWSVADPVPVGTKRAFDAAVSELGDRIRAVTALAS